MKHYVYFIKNIINDKIDFMKLEIQFLKYITTKVQRLEKT